MRRTLILSLMVASSVVWANPPQTFSAGSLIIPVQNNFQSECGAASAYGLIWKLLYENRPGGAFSGNPVTIYWSIQAGKGSPNRCVPSNKHGMPLPSTAAAGKLGWDTGPWSDGCDFSVVNAGKQPVVLVNYGVAFPATPPYLYATGTIPEMSTNFVGGAIPSYDINAPTSGKGQRATLDDSGTCPAILPVGDAPPCGAARFTKIQYFGGMFLIDSTDAKRVIDAMRLPATYPQLAIHSSATACPNLNGTYKVNMHQATAQFDAPIYKRITNVPSRIALVETGGGVSGGILDDYLTNAGLTGTIAGTAVAGTPASPGLVYDKLRALDDMLSGASPNPKGYLNSKVSGKSRYKVMWAPHWELDNSDLASGTATDAQRADALGNIAYFADQKGNGVMAECASIEGYEGGLPEGGIVSYNPATNFMFDGQIRFNGLTTRNGRNCTDPHYVNGFCTVYPDPGDPFAQVGDFAYAPSSGHVESFRINGTGGTRRPGVKRLAHSWKDYPTGFPSAAMDTGENGWDFFTLRQKDNDPEKSTIIYIAGHKLTSDGAGTRVILNTLLNLGSDPVASDRNYTQPVGFIDASLSNTPTLVSSVFGVITGTLNPGSQSYSIGNGKNFMWPFTPGNLRGRNADVGLNVGVNELNDALLWNADSQMPLPADRNLFTYFGGVSTAAPALSGSRTVRNDVAQLGWVPARVEETNLNGTYTTIPNPNCTDVVQFGDHKSKVAGQHDPGLIAGSDGICDIQQAIQWTSLTPDVDLSGKHKMKASDVAKYQAEALEVRQFLQIVRGFCFANDVGNNPIMSPTDAECLSYGAVGDNRAHMGGAVRSTAAIVTASTRITDNGAPRPTVAYVGTWDGQLHAFYVGGGSGYTGPAGGRQYLNPTCLNASCPQAAGDPRNGGAATFKVNWSTKFATGGAQIPTKGTELWSFLPATQLPWLKLNSAKVDSSPVVQDAFIDLYGDGVRRWHTILVASIGGTGRELFAMDVTNPLQPVLLWDIVGSNYRVGSFPDFPATAMGDDDITGNARPLEWDNTKTDYILPPLTDPGRKFGMAYDYAEMGGSRALTIGQMREGLEPNYAVFVSTNASGYGAGPKDSAGREMSSALIVHAIDLATGQKIWQWQQPYIVEVGKPDYRMAENTVPPPVSMRVGGDGASSLLVGDMEGRLWELDAATGRSLTSLRDSTCTTAACNFPAFDTRGTDVKPQPITSTIAIARVPPLATGHLSAFSNDNIVILGTAGADWVKCLDSSNLVVPCSDAASVGVGGKVHTILLEDIRRLPVLSGGPQVIGTTNCLSGPCTDWSDTTARAKATTDGVLQQTPPLALTTSNRVYGNINVSGQYAYVPLVTGIGGDPMALSKTQGGKTLELNLGGIQTTQATAEMANFNNANFGGVAVFTVDRGSGNTQTLVVGDQNTKTSKYAEAAAPAGASKRARNTALSTNQTLPYRLYNMVRRFFSQQ